MYFRLSFNAPPLGRVTKWFTTDQSDECQKMIGKLQLKGIRVDVQRVTEEQYRELREQCDDESD